MDFTPYDAINFRSYQMDRPNLLDCSSLGNRNGSVFQKFLLDVATIACEYTYNKKLTSENVGDQYTHQVYINITKHLCVCISCEYEYTVDKDGKIKRNKISKMYLTDILLEKDVEDVFWIREIKAFKLNTGNVPNLDMYMRSYTVGLYFGGKDEIPDKLPLIGIAENKVFIPKRSAFLEGPHVDIYKQDFDFDCYPEGTRIPFNADGENLGSNPKRSINLKISN